MRKRYIPLFLILIVGLNLNACVTLQESPISGNKRVYGYTWEEEKKIGREADREIISQYGLYGDIVLLNYVSDLGQELLEVSHMQREGTPEKFSETEFTFRVLDSPVVNAFALPGGYVYVTRGLLSHLNNQAQLAVVLGHEIGHVAARHASQRAAEQQFGQIAVISGAILGESFGLDGGNILQLSSQTAQLLFLKYGRDDERESDKLGVEYSAMKGYVAAEGAEFFTSLKRISENQGNAIPSLLSTHPDPGEREETIPRLAKEWEERGYSQTIKDRDEYLNIIDHIIYGNDPRSGFTQNGIFYHPRLRFQFPVPETQTLVNQANALILFDENKEGITQVTIDNQSITTKASVEDFLYQEGITVLEQRSTTFNGYSGHQAVATAQTNQGKSLKLILSALLYDGTIYQFLSYAPADRFTDYESVFRSVPDGFSELTDPEILNIKPVRLELTAAQKTVPFRELIPAELPLEIKPEEVAIINQVDMDETIEEGTIIKIPVQK